jgi:hypothetical protein
MITKTWIKDRFPVFGLFSDQELEQLMVHVLRESQTTHLSVEEILRRIDGEVESEMAQA